MFIKAENLSKKFNKEWIFKDLTVSFEPNRPTAVTGTNGSGKSTLLQCLASFTYPTSGTIKYQLQGKEIHPDHLYKHLSFASPYQELLESYTLEEHLYFHEKFKPFKLNLTPTSIINRLGFQQSRKKVIKNFSSGMKQKVKLALAILSDTPILLLDEPVSNLDAYATEWFKEILSENSLNRIIIISSNNVKDELFSCTQNLNILDFK